MWANFKFITSKVSGGSQNHSAYSHSTHLLQDLSSALISRLQHFLKLPHCSLHRSVLNIALLVGLQWLSSEVNWDLKTEFYDAPRSNIVPNCPQGNTIHCTQIFYAVHTFKVTLCTAVHTLKVTLCSAHRSFITQYCSIAGYCMGALNSEE